MDSSKSDQCSIPTKKKSKSAAASEFEKNAENKRYLNPWDFKVWWADLEKRAGYQRQSVAETAMYRLKTLLGDRLQSRKFENQWAEVLIKVNILNRIETQKACS